MRPHCGAGSRSSGRSSSRSSSPRCNRRPCRPERRSELLQRSALGRRFLEVSARTPLEFVREEFEHEVVRAGLLFFNGMREIDLQAPGFGHSIAAILAGRHKAQMCLGGSARLAEALAEDIREHGGEIRLGVQPRAILTRAGGRSAWSWPPASASRPGPSSPPGSTPSRRSWSCWTRRRPRARRARRPPASATTGSRRCSP